MKTIVEKTRWFTITITLCLVVVTLFVVSSCDKSEALPTANADGVLVGYVNCYNNIGLYIITEKKDSLLTFNVPMSYIGIDINTLQSGFHDIRYYNGDYNIKCDGINIDFDYRMAVGKEIKQSHEYLCPQNAQFPGFTHGADEDYTQIIITNIKLTTP